MPHIRENFIELNIKTFIQVKKHSDEVNLICFPYAGGSKYSYRSFEAVIPRGINLIPLELPGRGDRVNERLLIDINAMVEDLLGQMNRYTNKPYILYGHSMGGILAYLVAKRISNDNIHLPECLVITGCEGPSVKNDAQKARSLLPSVEFFEELKTLGGIPDEILKDEGIREFFEPILRADLKAIEGFKYRKSIRLNVPICIIFGVEEDISLEEASSWVDESNSRVEIFQFPGDHFFIFKYEKKLMEVIEKKFNECRHINYNLDR